MDWQYLSMAIALIIFIALLALVISLIRWLNASAAQKRANIQQQYEKTEKKNEEERK